MVAAGGLVDRASHLACAAAGRARLPFRLAAPRAPPSLPRQLAAALRPRTVPPATLAARGVRVATCARPLASRLLTPCLLSCCSTERNCRKIAVPTELVAAAQRHGGRGGEVAGPAREQARGPDAQRAAAAGRRLQLPGSARAQRPQCLRRRASLQRVWQCGGILLSLQCSLSPWAAPRSVCDTQAANSAVACTEASALCKGS